MSATEGVRKDAISHGLKQSILNAGGYPAYFIQLLKVNPGKHADLVAKYIPQEIEHLNAPPINVLIVNMPPDRRVSRNIKGLDDSITNVIDITDTSERRTINDQLSTHAQLWAGMDGQNE